MAMGRRQRQKKLWIAATDVPDGPVHPFWAKLNELLGVRGSDDFVGGLCAKFYHEWLGRPGIPPGVCFRMLLIGYFEGIDSERGIAWRCADSLALRTFLGYSLSETPPEHSTLSVIRNRIDLETHQEVFAWVLGALADRKLLVGKTIGIDATTLEANAAMRSIVRKDSGES
jgi:transposase